MTNTIKKNCYNGIHNFSHVAKEIEFFKGKYVDPDLPKTSKYLINRNALSEQACKIESNAKQVKSALCYLIKNLNFSNFNADQPETDWLRICGIKKSFRSSLLSIASKLLSSEHQKLEDLTKEEQQLWNSDIYEFLTGEKDTIPEFQYNWIEPCVPAFQFPANCQLTQSAPAPPPAPSPQAVQPHAPVDQYQNAQPSQQVAQAPSPPQPQPAPASDGILRPKKDINYKELDT